MILVTGAAGKTGQAVVRALLARRQKVKVWVFRDEQRTLFPESQGLQTVSGDLRSAADTQRALDGVSSAYLIYPNMCLDESKLADAFLAVCRTTGLRHLVYHSVLHPQALEMPHHRQKLLVEQLIFASKLTYTILQPSAYMQNILGSWQDVCREGFYQVPYGTATRMSMVDLEDVAEAAAKVLTEPGHEAATYELCGPEVMDQADVARTFSQCLGRSIEARSKSLRDWERQIRRGGHLTEEAIATLKAMFKYYDRNDFIGNPSVLSWLLGRRPTTLGEFVRRQAQTLS